jgi:glycosyltransferase involved in cell wall biosynthesis
MSDEGLAIFLFGNIQTPSLYKSKSIRIFGNRKGVRGAFQAFLRILWLLLSRPIRFIRLKEYLAFGPFSGISQFRMWSKYVPVLLHLPDIFHVQWAKSAGDWIWLKDLFGTKLILSLRGTQITQSPISSIYWESLYKKAFPQYDGFHAVCHSILEKAIGYGVPPTKAKVIYSGVQVTETHISDYKIKGPLKILCVGRFHWLKGYNYLLDSLAILKRKDKAFTCKLIAPGEMPEEIIYQVHDLNLTREITWVKGLPHREVLMLMKTSDILVLPSLEEGIPNVVLEALSMGLPVISTNCGGVNEVIDDGLNGFLVPVRNSGALAESILKFINLPHEAIHRIRLNGIERIKEFSSTNMTKSFVKFYRGVLDGI